MREALNPAWLYAPGGAYSHVVKAGSLVFLYGVTGMDTNRRLVGTDVASQTRRALRNLETGLGAPGGSLADVRYLTHFLEYAKADFHAYNAAYAEFFPSGPRARDCSGSHPSAMVSSSRSKRIVALGGSRTVNK